MCSYSRNSSGREYLPIETGELNVIVHTNYSSNRPCLAQAVSHWPHRRGLGLHLSQSVRNFSWIKWH